MNVPRYFVERVEYKRVPPHDNCHCIITIGKAVCANQKPLAVWECPDAEHEQEVDKVAQIRQEVVVAFLMIRVEADRHKVDQLCSVP